MTNATTYNVTEHIVRICDNGEESWTEAAGTKHWTATSLEGISSSDIQGNEVTIYTYIGDI
jgi:hypothetical protein